MRLKSLDALRGFDMLMIMGTEGLIGLLCVALGFGSDCWFAQQFRHVEWNGLRFEDTIFPLFLFLAGVAWPFSCRKQIERGSSWARIMLRCLKRAAILFLLGLVYGGLLDGTLRMGSVLGRIGVAWMIGAYLYLWFPKRVLAILALAIPLGYWALLYFVPAPDALTIQATGNLAYVTEFGRGPFSILGNLSGYVDRTLMPGVLIPYTNIADNQSALGYIPAIGTALLGILTGEFLRWGRDALSAAKRIGIMLGGAAVLVALGLVIANCFGEASMPINKKLWSTSFTFVVGGYSLAMLALFHLVVDVWGCEKLVFPFTVIGMNSITIYMARKFIDFHDISTRVFGGVASLMSKEWSMVFLVVMMMVIEWFFLYFLYKKNIFLKV